MSCEQTPCSVGLHLGETCHKLSYTKQIGQRVSSELSDVEKDLIMWRTGLPEPGPEGFTICYHHEKTVVVKYASYQRKCCNPFNLEKHSAKGSLREITIDVARDMKEHGISVKPGEKLCPSCRMEVEKQKQTKDFETSCEGDDEYDDAEAMEQEITLEADKKELNVSFEEINVSPVKLHAIGEHSKVTYGKRKVSQLQNKLKEKHSRIKEKIANVLNVAPEEIECSEQENAISDEINNKASDLDRIVELMKEKIQISPRKTKIQVLTMTPSSWSVRKTAEVFGVSNYMVRKAFGLRKEKGILATPEAKKGNVLPDTVESLVKEFYCDDENSRLLPGKKDYVSIGRNHHMQKRLILSNLKELYSSFKERNPAVKIGFSKFCMLRPKWCITIGASGTHSVCVCTYHQNVILLLNAIKIDKTYHELIEMIVCDRDSKECMVHRCSHCPGIEPLKAFLTKALIRNESDDSNADSSDNSDSENDESDDPEITFNQWSSTDRAELIKQTTSLSDFIEILSDKLNKITVHSFIAKAQGSYLKQQKENLDEKDVIVLVDFAENYKFLVQD
jgi:hypothetical protein